MYKLKSFLIVVVLLAIIIFISFFISDPGITSASIAKHIACFDDSDCNDHISGTEDICRNPGTEYSLCVNKPNK